MNMSFVPVWCVAALVSCATAAHGLDLTSGLTAQSIRPSSPQVTATQSPGPSGIAVAIAQGSDPYPGITLTPTDGVWDLSPFGHVSARIVNTGVDPLRVSLRIDNAGPWSANAWNSEWRMVQPGATGTVSVLFGTSWGKPGYALNSAAVVRMVLFAGKADKRTESFRIVSLEAGGLPGEKPPVDPNSIRIAPPKGLLLGDGVFVDAATQLVSRGARATAVTNAGPASLRVNFPSGRTEMSVLYRPPVGRWNLSAYLDVHVAVTNEGKVPVILRTRLECNAGPTEWSSLSAPLAPGAAAELVIPFIPSVPWVCQPSTDTPGHRDGKPGTGTRLTSDAVSGVAFAAGTDRVDRVVRVVSIRAGVPPAPALPAWLGKRPPVKGDWTMTFDEEFDGTAIDTNKWNVFGQNWYDKVSHYSKDNVILGNGLARLRYEKKRGWHNDDPNFKPWGPTAVGGQTDYATGFLDTAGKWTQRYGYFESRLKLPSAPGMWPAFWMMPDRGETVSPAGARRSTSDGGMEFDIMEQLSRWGPYRYNIAMHWDGYGKEHKTTGTGTLYVQPDKDGFLTCGLLWQPGLAVYYCNGREVLRWEDPRVSNVPSQLIFTLPCGGWDNNAVDDAQLPADFVIDYVRVWQMK
jgi:beta-glucanase (GH16 family)